MDSIMYSFAGKNIAFLADLIISKSNYEHCQSYLPRCLVSASATQSAVLGHLVVLCGTMKKYG